MKQKRIFCLLAAVLLAVSASVQTLLACTGISFIARDGSKVIGRTMEWGTYYLESRLVLVPRGHVQMAMTPSGLNGVRMEAKYGYFGIGVLEHKFMAEGMNEMGLAGQLFYFPGYGSYEEYDPAYNRSTVYDAQFLDWVLGRFATIAELEKELGKIHVVGYGQGFGSVHYSLADASGRQVVLEFLDGKVKLFENKVGVITNAPSFDWHMTNLNNYINAFSGGVPAREIASGVRLESIGVGSGAMGLPGDLTPPSRFVRAAFYVHTALPQATGEQTVMQIFQILNNFDLPIGTEFRDRKDIPDGMLSATQWTTALDLKARKFYYRTEWNNMIRCVDLKQIDFSKVYYQVRDMDEVRENPVEMLTFR